jgi:microcompartment protein CcmL/EutN
VRCPRDGTAGTIYGTRIYTDDSSICTAAAHAGVITLERGGRVTIEIRGGRSSYESTTRHGITSASWGEYGRSFVVKYAGGRIKRDEPDGGVTAIDWDTNATGFTGETGQTYTFRCPQGGAAWPIYGTGDYTDDSSICTAAVHAGLISFARGGRVTIEIRGGRSSYQSSTRHGVTSQRWGEYGRGYVFR